MKRIIKKGLSVFLSVLFMVSAVPLSGFVGLELPHFSTIVSHAADEEEIFVNDSKRVSVSAGSTVYLKFVPLIRGTYIFYSTGSSDTYGYLYDSNKKSITSNNNISDSDKNFRISYELKAGRTYFWGVKYNNSSTSGNIRVKLEMQCEHIYQKEVTKEATCEQTGEVVYTCSICNYSYTDKLPRHVDNDSDNICDLCGETTKTVFESGSCNSTIEWLLYDDGELEIIGTGDMPNYSFSSNLFFSINYSHPWSSYSSIINRIVISDGITSIGDYCFGSLTSLEDVRIPESVMSIGMWAFGDCTSLSKICVYNSDTVLSECAFGYYHYRTNIFSPTSPLVYDNCCIFGVVDSNANSYADDNNIPFYCYHGFNSEDCFITEIETTPCGDIVRLSCTQCDQTWLDTSAVIHDYSLTNSICDCINGGIDTYICNRCNNTYTVNFAARHADINDDGFCDYCNEPFGGVLDLVFCIDTTGSMGAEIAAVKNNIASYAQKLEKSNIPYYIAIVDYRDFSERSNAVDYPYSVIQDFSNNIDEILSGVNKLNLGSGGDTNETVYSGLMEGLADLHWGYKSARKVILIGDAPPLDPEPNTNYELSSVCEKLNEDDVSVYTVATGNAEIEKFNSIAQSTGGSSFVCSDNADFENVLYDVIDSIPDSIHIHDYEVTVLNEATCLNTGLVSYTCSGCGRQLNNVVTEALGHDYSFEHFETDTDSYTVYTCTRCGDAYTVLDPAVPVENFIAFSGTYKVNLSWLKAVEASVTGYEIFRKTEDDDQFVLLKRINSRNTLSYIDDNLVADKEYSYRIRAMKGDVEGDFSEIVVAVPSPDTTKPTIINVSPTNFSIKNGLLEIKAVGEDDIGVVSFILSLSADKGENWETVYTGTGSFFSYNLDTTTYSDGEYQVRLVARDEAGNESDGYIINCAFDNNGPEKVTGVNASNVYSSKLTLKWNDVSDNDRAGFILQMLKGDSFVNVHSKINTIGYNVSNLVPNTEYTFRVAAYDQLGNIGEYSDEYTVKTLEDSTAPVITKQSPAPTRYSSSFTFSATAEDDCEISSIRIEISSDAETWTTVYTKSYSGSAAASISNSIDVSTLPEGSLFVRAVAIDKSSNASDTSSAAPYVEYYVDHTAPEAPKGINAIGADGYIEIRWNQGNEADLNKYSIFRSAGDGSNYTCIASSLTSLNYYDRSVQRGMSYNYKIQVNDIAGNKSEYSEVVSATALTDSQKPEIKSVSPSNGSSLGPNNNQISVLAADNNMLSTIVVEYKTSLLDSYTVLKEFTNINNYYKTVSATLPMTALNDGDTVYVRAYCVDTSSLVSECSSTIELTVDKNAPSIKNISGILNSKSYSLSWGDCEENDLSGFKIYRSMNGGGYSAVASRSASSSHNYSLTHTLSEGAYTYRIDAVDTCGNVRSYYTEPIIIEKNTVLKPEIVSASYFEIGVQEVFSAENSRSDLGIQEYNWDFGDGTSSTAKKPIKAFAESGTYVVSLTLTDNGGNVATINKSITVNERQLLGVSKVQVVDENGNSISGMPVYFDLGNNNQQIVNTNQSGYASATLPVGTHVVGTYKNGYLPSSKQVNVLSGETVSTILTVEKNDLITGEFHVTEMTLDEIVAAGIDISDPANQQIYNVTVTLVYGTQRIPVSYVRNESKILSFKIHDTDIATGGGSGGGSNYKIKSISYIPNTANEEIIAVVAVPITASYLKQFFNAELTIFNNSSSEFNIIDCNASINVPDGLTVVGGSSIASVIPGQSSSSANWILRGDKPGTYNLSASFAGVLEGFNTPVSATFEADESVTVYGPETVKLRIEVKDEINRHLYFNVCLVNNRNVNVYCPNINVSDFVYNITEYYKKMHESSSFPAEQIEGIQTELLHVGVINSDGLATFFDDSVSLNSPVDTIKPGEQLIYEYCVNNVTDYVGAAYFNKAIIACDDYYKSSIEVIPMSSMPTLISEDQFITEHKEFINSSLWKNADTQFPARLSNALKEEWEDDWYRFIEFDYFTNYAEITLADYILQQSTYNTMETEYEKLYYDAAKTGYEKISELIWDDIWDTTVVDELDLTQDKIYKILTGGHYDSAEYKSIEAILNNKISDGSIRNVFNTLYAADIAISVYEFAGDSIEKIRNSIDYKSSLDAYRLCNDEYFKNVFENAANNLDADEKKMKKAMESYISYDNSSDFGAAVKKAILDLKCAGSIGTKAVFSLAKFAFEDMYVAKVKVFASAAMHKLLPALSAGSDLKIAAIAQGITIGYSLGVVVSKLVANTGNLNLILSQLAYYTQLASALEVELRRSEQAFINNDTYENALYFCTSFGAFKTAWLGTAELFAQFATAKNDALATQIFCKDKFKDNIADAVSILSYINQLNCHGVNHIVASSSKTIVVECPVDVYVYNSTGEILAKVSDSSVENNDSSIFAITYDGAKIVSMPCLEDYKVKIVANDSGTMDYTVLEYMDGIHNSRRISYNDILLHKDDVFDGSIDKLIAPDDPAKYDLLRNNTDAITSTDDEFIEVTGVELDIATASVCEGESFNLIATVVPCTASNKTVAWYSSDESVVSVDENGFSTAISEGTALIRCVTQNGEYVDYCSVTVTKGVCEHEFSDWIVVKAATCIQEGSKEKVCSICGEKEVEVISKTSHDYTALKTDVTCTTDGFTTYTCSVCGDSYVDDVVKTNGHNYGDWVIKKAATCKEQGVEIHACANCTVTETRTVAVNPNNHAYGTKVVGKKDATATADGYTGDTVCNGCGAKLASGSVIPKTGGNTQPQRDPNACKWCGKVHTGFFQKIIGFFHRILAAIFGARY